LSNTSAFFRPSRDAAFSGISVQFAPCSALFDSAPAEHPTYEYAVRASRPATYGVFAMPTASPVAPNSTPEPTILVKLPEAARMLAMSERSLWQLTKDGSVRCVRLGRAVRYDRRDLLAFVDAAKN
jgi:predicted DNA-binding transcriptional regulator AlpA